VLDSANEHSHAGGGHRYQRVVAQPRDQQAVITSPLVAKWVSSSVLPSGPVAATITGGGASIWTRTGGTGGMGLPAGGISRSTAGPRGNPSGMNTWIRLSASKLNPGVDIGDGQYPTGEIRGQSGGPTARRLLRQVRRPGQSRCSLQARANSWMECPAARSGPH
jgi:hypothetical protein